MHDAAFNRASLVDFWFNARNLKHFYTLKIAIDTVCPTKHVILTEIQIKIQFVMFLRGHPRTPIDPAPVIVGTGGKPSTWFPPGDS